MASQETPNYRLSRWAGTDRILVEEFNSDNEKIDAALKSNADAITAEAAAREAAVTALASKSRFTKLGEWSLPADSTTFEIPLTGIDWANWDKVHLDCGVKNGSTVTLYLNSTSNSIMQITSTWSGTIRPRYTLEPGYNADRMVSIRYAANCKVYTDLTYSNVTKLIFNGSEMVAGSIAILWGEK